MISKAKNTLIATRELFWQELKALRERAGLLPVGCRFMEVCGTHTQIIGKAGLRSLLPSNIELCSGPGCPVCVTPVSYLDRAIALGLQHGVILASFGDLLRVPSSTVTLEEARAEGLDIEVIYSPRDCLELARRHPDRRVVFLAVGFETTAPLAAALLLEAQSAGIENLEILPGNKTMPGAMLALTRDQDLRLDGFLLPGHVSVILGLRGWDFLQTGARLPSVITGFEALDVVQGCRMLVEQVLAGSGHVENQYRSAVNEEGNPQARDLLDEVFEPCDSTWRGLGPIAASGLALRDTWQNRDAGRRDLVLPVPREHPGCRCGDVLKGLCRPDECPHFAIDCKPDHALGACMVSGEGACAAWYRHERNRA